MDEFKILVVCTGNICRSPQAEQLLRSRFAAAAAVDASWTPPIISSAGVRAQVDSRMTDEAAALSRDFGGEPIGHRARQLTKELVDESDLILAMTLEHRGSVAKLSPRASRRAFTLLEYAHIAESLERENVNSTGFGDLRSGAARIAAARGLTALDRKLQDVIDPYRRDQATYRASIGQILPAVETIAAALLAQ